MNTKPIISITMGDPAGVSTEVVVSNIEYILEQCRPVVFGHYPTFEKLLRHRSLRATVRRVNHPVVGEEGEIPVVDCGVSDQPIGAPGPLAARAQFLALQSGVDFCLTGACDGLVTAPVSKEWVSTVSPGFTGHTEYLAGRAGKRTDEITMVFASDKLAVGLVSTHLPLKDVVDAVTHDRIERTLRHVAFAIRALGAGKRCRVGVAAINPHAGENGVLGIEEAEFLTPLCRELKNGPNLDLVGPIPADTLFRDALGGEYDGIISMYHDQAMIPLKLGGVGQTVNITMGLPFIRTSPDHGVAYDIAGKGLADPEGMRSAVATAVRLARRATVAS